jgi:hypothetical protein
MVKTFSRSPAGEIEQEKRTGEKQNTREVEQDRASQAQQRKKTKTTILRQLRLQDEGRA